MDAFKVLSVNPGTVSKLPHYESGARHDAIIPVHKEMDAMMRQISGRESPAVCLVVRLVAVMAICGGAALQLKGSMFVFGIERLWTPSAIAALILGVMLACGFFGRATALCLAIGAVTAMVNEAAANAGTMHLTSENMLMLVCGALAAIVSIIGTGRYTIPGMAGNLLKRNRERHKQRRHGIIPSCHRAI